MLVVVVLFAAFGGFLYGYDLGLISGALSYIRDDFNTSEIMEEAIVGAAKVGAVLGTFLGEPSSNCGPFFATPITSV